MKELLYIPGGTYVKVLCNGMLLGYEEYNDWMVSHYEKGDGNKGTLLEKTLNGFWFGKKFYIRNELGDFKSLTKEMFEIIETNQEKP